MGMSAHGSGDADSVTVSGGSVFERWAEAPLSVKAWALVYVATFLIGFVLGPGEIQWIQTAFWALIGAALIRAVLLHSRMAWVIALILAVLTLLGGLSVATTMTDGVTERAVPWGAARSLLGLVTGVLELALLVTKATRAWVAQPTERRWDP